MAIKRNKDLLTLARLKEVAHYDPLTGRWTRLKAVRGARLGFSGVGDRMGYILPCGHRVIRLDGHNHRASHLALFYMTGRWPHDEVDHKNVDPGDDSWKNLREANSSQNKCNRRVSTRSTSGLKGAFTYGKRWRSQIKDLHGKLHHLGVFDTAEQAHAAYAKAAVEMHGEWARAA